MKKLSTKHKIALIELVIVVIVCVWLFGPKSFERAMSFDFDPAAVTSVSAVLSNEPAGKEPITVTLDPADPAYGDLIAALESSRYAGKGSGGLSQSILLDYKAEIAFETDGALHCIRLCGNEFMDFYGSDEANQSPRAFKPTGGLETQQTVLDILLAAAG